MSRTLGFCIAAFSALYGVTALWNAFAWQTTAKATPSNLKASLEFAQAKPLALNLKSTVPYGPFPNTETKPLTASNFIPLEPARVDALSQGLQALYLSEFNAEDDAIDAWKYYKTHSPILHFFQPFGISASENEDKTHLLALPRRMDLSAEAAHAISHDTCQNLAALGHDCTLVNLALNVDGLNIHLNAEPVHMGLQALQDDPQNTWERAHAHRRHALTQQNQQPLSLTELNTLTPSSGYGFSEEEAQQGLYAAVQKPPPSFATNSNQDTVAQAAMRAAYDMVHSRYTDAIYQAKLNDGQAPDIAAQDAIALSQSALSSAAERAFEKFIQDNFGKRDFSGQNYEGLRGYFTTAFQHAAANSMKSVGRRFVNDLTSSGDFKSLEIRSELLKNIDRDIASAFIDTGLAAAKNSQYAFLRNLEVSYKILENAKPEYSILTLQPLYSSEGRKHNLFAQAAASHSGSRNSFTGGLGYRYMPQSENYVVGSNIFLDYERTYGHLRASAGLDYQTSLWGASANYYKGLSDWRDSETGFQERPMDGYDLELAGRMPFLPALEVFGRGYRWHGIDGADDIDGTEFRLEYTPVPAFTLEALATNEEGQEVSYGLGLSYNYIFGAPAEYLYDWQEQFRQKSASEYIFRKARRENEIRTQERVDPDAAAADAVAVGPAFVTSAPLAGATGVSIGTDVTLTFAADVLAGTGNIVFTDLTDASDDFTIPVGDARVSIATNTVTIDLSAQLLDFNSNYEVTFAAGVFEDATTNAPSPELASGDLTFTTVVDPTAGFPAATATLAPNTTGATFAPANVTASWQTTIDVGATPDGLIFETGGTGRGIGASFDASGLTFAAGNGSVTVSTANTLFGNLPLASIPPGLHHFVFVAKPTAAGEIGVYMDGIRVITEVLGGAMDGTQWSGGDVSGYGLVNNSVRAGIDTSAVSGLTLTNNLSFYSGQQPASF